jgi:rRNA-processing protein FCF1
VATNDRELRRKLRREHVPTIFLRERSHLEIEGFVN